MKVFLDTNVVVSAFTARGLCADLFRLVLAEHELQSGEVIVEELQRVLEVRFKIPGTINKAIIELLRSQATIVPRPETPAATGVSDPDDEWVIASTLAAGADVLITGDKALLSLKSVAGLSIHDPRSFWQSLKGPERNHDE